MKVNVLMVTYNHEKFIAQAIESALMQKTNFEYEIVIGEDRSTDRTRDIVVDFQRRFPDKIRLILHEKNVGGRKNFERTLAACRGEYVALLEGDDFWVSAEKLQKQVDFLDEHPEYSLCSHPVNVFYEGEGPERNYIWPQRHRESSTVKDLIEDLYFHTCSVMIRSAHLPVYPPWMSSLKMGDYPLFILTAERGPIAQIKDVMGSYRLHIGGIWSCSDDMTRYEENIKMYHCINKHFRFKYARIIRPVLADLYFKAAVVHDQAGRLDRARSFIAKNIKIQLLNQRMPSLNQFKMLARLYFPSFYNLSKRLLKA